MSVVVIGPPGSQVGTWWGCPSEYAEWLTRTTQVNPSQISECQLAQMLQPMLEKLINAAVRDLAKDIAKEALRETLEEMKVK